LPFCVAIDLIEADCVSVVFWDLNAVHILGGCAERSELNLVGHA
jgi:hypothetical protein